MNITSTIINILRNDTSIQSFLGATSSTDCPVFTSFNNDSSVNKQINITLEYGETIPFDSSGKTHDGTVRIFVVVKDNVDEPIKTINNIAKRILELIDIKALTSPEGTIYWVQKKDSDFTHYEALRLYELMLTFRFVITEN